MFQKEEQTGRSLVETLAVLALIAILTVAGLLGYGFVIRKYQEKQTVKQVAELGVRYALNRVKPSGEGNKVLMKSVYPEAERKDAYTVVTPDHGHASIKVLGSTSAFSVLVDSVTQNSCREILASGAYDAVIYGISNEDDLMNPNKQNVLIGSDYFKETSVSSEIEKKIQNALEKKNSSGEVLKEEIIQEVCQEQEKRVKLMALIWDGDCPKMGFSYGYQGKCWPCPQGESQDAYGACCSKKNECGVCTKCPTDKPYCDKKETKTCVECLDDSHCPGGACENHKCVPCIPQDTSGGGGNYSRGCEEEAAGPDNKKPWCSDSRICEECLESYEESKPDLRCPQDKPFCDTKPKEPNWKCETWPCAQKPLKEECLNGESGSIGLDGKCSDVCQCAKGLICKEGEPGDCPTCQCEKDAPRLMGDPCNAGCPCGTNANGAQLRCSDGKCTCIKQNDKCTDSKDCCSGYCYIKDGETSGTCQPKSCQKTAGDLDCSTDSANYANCCTDGTVCLMIDEEHRCCAAPAGKNPTGEEGSYCEQDDCCRGGLTCIDHQCQKDVCEGTLLDVWQNCSGEKAECCLGGLTCSGGYCCPENKCKKDENGHSLCCPDKDKPNCVMRSGESTCCPTEGNEGDKCTQDGCCQDETDTCKKAEDGEKRCCPRDENLPSEVGASCSACGCGGILKCIDGKCACPPDGSCAAAYEEQCCSSGKCNTSGGTPYQCCPKDEGLPTQGAECSPVCGCKSGLELTCTLDLLTNKYFCLKGCPNSDEERQTEGAVCTEDCPCGENAEGIQLTCADGKCRKCPVTAEEEECSEACPCGENADGIQMTCGSDNKCHVCESGTYFFQLPGTEGACCPKKGGSADGDVCTTDACCQSGNCSKMNEDDAEGVCCPSAYTLIRNRNNTEGQCCEKVDEVGEECTGGKNGGNCCKGGFCRQVYKRKQAVEKRSCAKTKNTTCYDCSGHKTKCKSCATLSNETYTIYEATNEDDGPVRCCEGDGNLGSPCSDECPCQGTAFIFSDVDKVEVIQTEYHDKVCSCQKIPALYCRPTGNGKGVCTENPEINSSGKKDFSANEVSCLYENYHFKDKNTGKCYLCPADSRFVQDDSSMGCCSLALNPTCQTYSKDKYQPHEESMANEGYYCDDSGDCSHPCKEGNYCVGGKSYPCDAGTYSNQQRSPSCRFCGQGYYCPKGAIDRIKCPAQTYCPGIMNTEPTDCPAGTYSNASGNISEAQCEICPVGSYCPGERKGKVTCTGVGLCDEEGLTEPKLGNTTDGNAQYVSGRNYVICPVGSKCDGVTKTACPKGTYSDHLGASECTPVEPGYYINGTGCTGKGKTCYKASPAGSYAPGTGNVESIKCPPGTYQDETGKAECKSCGDGMNSPLGATAQKQCTSCEGELAKTSGTVMTCCKGTTPVAVTDESKGGDYQKCCAAGKRYCLSKSNTWGCQPQENCIIENGCSKTQYISGKSCKDCPAGSSCNGYVATKCKPGTYAAAGDGVCTPCAAGTYQNSEGMSECKKTTSNQYVDTAGATIYKTCLGNTVPREDRTGCEECAPGMKVNYNNSACVASCTKGKLFDKVNGCQPCTAGYYCPDGLNQLPCPEGSFSKKGAEVCKTCNTGYYWNEEKDSCDQCPAGSYCQNGLKKVCPEGTTSIAKQTECSRCDPGQYFNTTSGSCTPCNAGYYSLGGTVTKCEKCTEGTYQPEKGRPTCLACPEGTYASSQARTYCDKCSAGKWTAGTGTTVSTQCTKENCPAGYFCDGKGNKEPCPEGTISSGGASRCLSCKPGQYFNMTSGSCTDCANGTYSPGGTATQCQPCGAGEIPASDKGSCVKCAEGKYKSGVSQCSNCAKGTWSNAEGTACEPCPAGYFCNSGTKTECPNCPAGATVKS